MQKWLKAFQDYLDKINDSDDDDSDVDYEEPIENPIPSKMFMMITYKKKVRNKLNEISSQHSKVKICKWAISTR